MNWSGHRQRPAPSSAESARDAIDPSPGQRPRTARIQRKADGAPRQPIERVSSTGSPMPTAVQRKMESSFGADFSDVRVHQDASPGQIGAQAYTQGNDVHFAAGRYQPHSQSGQELLGHELTHVVQQRAGRVGVQGKDAAINSDPTLEREADVQGARAARGWPTTVAGVATGRQPKLVPGHAPIQRYKDLGSDEYDSEQKKGEELFTSHADEPSIRDDPRKGVEYQRSNELSEEGLIVSEDGNLAAQKGVQAQEFFADAALLPGWNLKLQSAGTAVRLKAGKSSITANGKKLTIIKPTLSGEALESFLYTECVEVANTIMGEKTSNTNFTAIFEDNDQEHAPKSMDMSSSKVSKVASYAMDSSRDTNHIATGVNAQNNSPVGKKYGKESGKGRLDARAQDMGINEYAKPDVGEGYVAYSVRADSDKTSKKGGTDYTTQKDRRGLSKLVRQLFGKSTRYTVGNYVEESWDMHYAGVVAVSTDGADRVTLEDYNRGPEIDGLKTQLRRELETRYAEQIAELKRDKKDIASMSNLLTELAIKLDGEDWLEAKKLANAALSGGGKSTWYFRMYGSKQGQTFHDIGSEGTVNPLTMRIKKRDEE